MEREWHICGGRERRIEEERRGRESDICGGREREEREKGRERCISYSRITDLYITVSALQGRPPFHAPPALTLGDNPTYAIPHGRPSKSRRNTHDPPPTSPIDLLRVSPLPPQSPVSVRLMHAG